ncbi:MAG TPA: histidinol dehydrogenase [Dehalococcoidales bacterium]|nr:histidinol dehydrogenase [Dehalococcoidales bacterium]
MKIVEGYAAAKSALSRPAQNALAGADAREKTVRQIIDDVRGRGDAALYDYTEKFDGVRLASLEVDKKEIDRAAKEIDAGLRGALKLAADRIAAYHAEQKNILLKEKTGGKLGWVIRPLDSVGVHVPGFSAPLPSSLLMTAIPARVAGVKEIVLVTPPGKRGRVSPLTLAAAALAGVDRVFAVGGAQAVAALAYGTESVPRVDKVCGPGNIYVSLAKKMVYGVVGIDGLYGPSEVIIIADETANPAYCAADLLAQAEHGSMAAAVLITTSRRMADRVNGEIERQLADLPRKNITSEALEKRGLIALVGNVDEAIELANLYAPEHLCLVVAGAASYVDKVRHAGCLFVGENAVEVLVDYVAGPSHVLPTDGTARFGSTLNISDFVKIMTVVRTDEDDIRELGNAASIIASAEGLDAHARAVAKRLEGKARG